MDIATLVKLVNKEFPLLVKIRRAIHCEPELSGEEYKTQKMIITLLTEWGIEHKVCAKTGVLALIRGNGRLEKCIGLRADMDALPMQDLKNVEYASKIPGVAHACGHDAHTAILLIVAKILQKIRGEIDGDVKLFFQPAEEKGGGAYPMICEGALESPSVNALIGLHMSGRLEVGKIGFQSKIVCASSRQIEIEIQGVSAHGATPESGIDAIVVACHVVVALQTAISRYKSALSPVVLTFGMIQGGTKENIIANSVVLRGTMRTHDESIETLMIERITKIIEGVCEGFGSKSSITIKQGYPLLRNNSEMVELLKHSAKQIVGENSVVELPPSMGGEDFAFFSKLKPTVFYRVGAQNSSKGISCSEHMSCYDIDEEALRVAVKVQILAVLNYFSK